MAIRILLNGLGRDTGPTGICRVAANHASALARGKVAEHLLLAVGAWQEEMYRSLLGAVANEVELVTANIKNSSLSRNRWFAAEVPRLAKKFSPSLVHYSFPAPVIRRSFECPVVVTLHDLYPYDLPANFGFPNYFFNRMILRQSLNSVDGIACVSNATKSRLLEIFPGPAGRAAVEVTGNYVKVSNSGREPSGLAERLNGLPFILSVAQHRKNKNLDILIRAYARLLKSGRTSCQLLIVGARGPETELLTSLAKSLDVSGKIIFQHAISDAELSWLYRHCMLFAASSSIEGYCLPVAEALLHDARVLCSDIAILRDIAGEQAAYFSLKGDAVENLATAMEAAMGRPTAAHALGDRFSEEAVLAAYCRLYARVC
jgi:glycosyltransferase involved in cell wall biosynthesis